MRGSTYAREQSLLIQKRDRPLLPGEKMFRVARSRMGQRLGNIPQRGRGRLARTRRRSPDSVSTRGGQRFVEDLPDLDQERTGGERFLQNRDVRIEKSVRIGDLLGVP